MDWLRNRYVVLGIYIIGMTLIPFNDSLMKLISGTIPVFEFLATRGGLMLIGVFLFPVTYFALREAGWIGFLQVFLRGSMLVAVLTLLFVSISMVPLATAYAVFFTAPMMISLAAVPLLGERLTWVRLVAVSLGLVGAMVNAQPWREDFSPWLLLTVLAAVIYAAYQIITRMLPQSIKVGAAMVGMQVSVIFWGGLVSWAIWQFGWQNDSQPGLDFLTRDWVMFSGPQWGIMVLCAGITLIWAYAATFAYRVAEASFVAPIEYISLPLAAFWGLVLLDETFTLVELLGLAIIVFGGVLMAFDPQDKDTVNMKNITEDKTRNA